MINFSILSHKNIHALLFVLFACLIKSGPLIGGPHADQLSTTYISDIRLVSVNYDEAEIDILVNYAGDDDVYLNVYISDMSEGYFPYKIKSGQNNVKVFVPRGKRRHAPITTDTAKVFLVSKNSRKKIYEKIVDIVIDWPGPEYIQEVLAGKKIEKNDYSTVRLISIDKFIDPKSELYTGLLLKGAPINKVRKFGMIGGNAVGFDHAKIVVGSQVDVNVVKIVVSQVMKSNHIKEITSIEYGDTDINKFSDNDIYIKFGNINKSMDKDVLNKLVSSNTDDHQFYNILGLEKPNTKEVIEKKYKLAYRLIDSDGKNNIDRAKGLLDEIIALDPNYPRAYLELARYHMKTSPDFLNEGLKKAERSILIAKRMDPELADTRVLLGYVYTYQKRYEEAEKEYILAHKLGTDNLWLHANWGINYEMQGKYQEAIEKYSVVMEANRTFDRNDRPKTWTKNYIFPLLMREKEYEKADKLYSKYVREFPGKNCALIEQSNLRLFMLDDYQGAIDSHMNATRAGCRKKNPSLALAYYVKWDKKKN